MELIATSRQDGEPVAFAYGAVPINGGRALMCGLLFVRRGCEQSVLNFRDPQTKSRYRVRLPKELLRQKGHARVLRVDLEVVS